MRTEKSIRNLFYGEVNIIFTVLLSMVTRTALVRILGLSAVSLNGLFTEVIAVLSLAELGVGSAITYHLYRPLAEHDRKKVVQRIPDDRRSDPDLRPGLPALCTLADQGCGV